MISRPALPFKPTTQEMGHISWEPLSSLALCCSCWERSPARSCIWSWTFPQSTKTPDPDLDFLGVRPE